MAHCGEWAHVAGRRIWSAFNVIVLFLVCMMSLQAPRRRGEERFDLDEPVWIIGPGGAVSSGRIKDISLSGVRLEEDTDNTGQIQSHCVLTPEIQSASSLQRWVLSPEPWRGKWGSF